MKYDKNLKFFIRDFYWNNLAKIRITHYTKVNLKPALTRDRGRDPFNQNSNRSDREKRTTSKGGPVFSKLFRLDRTDPLSFGPKFPEILVEWIAPRILPEHYISLV